MAATSCGSMLNRCSLTMHSRFSTLLQIEANTKPKPLHESIQPLFSQKAEASMVGICPLYSMILQEMHFNGDCYFRIWYKDMNS